MGWVWGQVMALKLIPRSCSIALHKCKLIPIPLGQYFRSTITILIISQVKGEVRDTRAGLGMSNSSRSLDSASDGLKRSQSVRNRFDEAVHHQKAKKQRLDLKNL